jgi:hypothetical protein
MSVTHNSPVLFADINLARRLERTEATACAEFVETRARHFPDSGARWIEVAGAYAMFDGPASPITQTFGLGMFQPLAAADLDTIEGFYRTCGAPVYHEVSPLSDPTVLALLNARGYQPFEFTSVMFCPLDATARLASVPNPRLQVRLVKDDEHQLFARTAAQGWSEARDLADQLSDLMLVNARRPGALSFLAELDGRAIASAALVIFDRVALMAGASTIPDARKHGAQLALLESRLRLAAERGCDVVMMGALPGSASQRNAERHGFRIAYTRIKWRQPARKE